MKNTSLPVAFGMAKKPLQLQHSKQEPPTKNFRSGGTFVFNRTDWTHYFREPLLEIPLHNIEGEIERDPVELKALSLGKTKIAVNAITKVAIHLKKELGLLLSKQCDASPIVKIMRQLINESPKIPNSESVITSFLISTFSQTNALLQQIKQCPTEPLETLRGKYPAFSTKNLEQLSRTLLDIVVISTQHSIASVQQTFDAQLLKKIAHINTELVDEEIETPWAYGCLTHEELQAFDQFLRYQGNETMALIRPVLQKNIQPNNLVEHGKPYPIKQQQHIIVHPNYGSCGDGFQNETSTLLLLPLPNRQTQQPKYTEVTTVSGSR